ncbi:MAG: HlyD family efflux transporter periplasmic adaptor subunit [Chloroflexi bacterium]|nr:HlyD family efflux transporter periplasmic adaptor subunit [Chloroflexota bacterium]
MTRKLRTLILIAFAGLLMAGCQTAQEQATPTPIPTPIVAEQTLYTVQRGTVQKLLKFNARVSPIVEEELAFKAGGYVSKVHVERNQSVLAGDVIAELEMEGALNSEAQAQVALEKVQLSLEQAQQSLERQLTESKVNLEAKEIQLAKKKLQDPALDVQAAAHRVTLADAARGDAQAAYDRIAWQPGVEATRAARNLQDATINWQLAKIAYAKALEAKEAFDYDVQLLEKDLELAKLKHSYLEQGVDQNLVKAVEQAQLSLDRLQGQVAQNRILSPIDGIVTTLAVTEGRAVEAFKTVAIVADQTNLELAVQLSDAEMQNLEVEMPVTVTLATYAGRAFPAKIIEMPYPYGQGGSQSKLDKADQFTHLALNDTSIELRMGDVAACTVLLEEEKEALWLPPAAVRSFEGRNFVVVDQEGRQRRIDIKVGIVGEERIQILEGLEGGQSVIGQ